MHFLIWFLLDDFLHTHTYIHTEKGQKVFWLLCFVYITSMVHRGWCCVVWGFFPEYMIAANTYQTPFETEFSCVTLEKYCKGKSSAGCPQITPVSCGISHYLQRKPRLSYHSPSVFAVSLCFQRWTAWYFCDEIVCPFVTLLSHLGNAVKLGCRCIRSHGRGMHWELLWAVL